MQWALSTDIVDSKYPILASEMLEHVTGKDFTFRVTEVLFALHVIGNFITFS